MRECPVCQLDNPTGSRFCSSCGTRIFDPSPTASLMSAPRVPTTLPASPTDEPPPSPGQRPRLETGAILASRYRIVAMLGRGGMGEVYRAEDLELVVPVALKFLPADLTFDPARLDRLRAEVRLARQITSPHVCRVFDIVRTGGSCFITMEYIAGEDLASLLRRIGRLPADKALVVARQICLGLAAAHDQGVIHRDLKPANIMIDARGHAKLTDFGLAAALEDLADTRESFAGTPAYMAPEQLAGREVSKRSDIYSLGLVLYEMFSGRPAHAAASVTELRRRHDSGARPASLSDFVMDVDHTTEDVILRCLSEDPSDRPESAIAVITSLPGADPLRAVLDAGQTPSPELVARSGARGALRLRPALLLLVAALASIPLATLVHRLHSYHHAIRLESPPIVLLGRAREIVKRLGSADPSVDSVHGVRFDTGDALRIVDAALKPDAPRAARDAAIRRQLGADHPASFYLWLRQSPGAIVTRRADGAVTPDDPALGPGDVSLRVSQAGYLTWLRAIPLPFATGDAARASQVSLDPAFLFEAAGLDLSTFQPAEPIYAPPTTAFDERRAWTGAYSNLPGVPLRVEVAAMRGRPVAFTLLHPWELPAGNVPAGNPSARMLRASLTLADSLYAVLLVLAAGAGVFIAHRQLRLRRGDPRGALRLAAVTFLAMAFSWSFSAHHTLGPSSELSLFLQALGISSAYAIINYGLYIALEPVIRRRSPELLVSSTRLLSGLWRDPLVGRDILTGLAFVSAYKVSELLAKTNLANPFAPSSGASGHPASYALSSPSGVVVLVADLFVKGSLGALLTLAGAVYVLGLARSRILGLAACFLIFFLVAARYFTGLDKQGTLLGAAGFAALALALALRFGLLALAVSYVSVMLFNACPATFNPSDWYFTSAALCFAVVAGLSIYALRIAAPPRLSLDTARSLT